MAPTEPSRLDRMEERIDKIAEALTTLARVEERMVTIFKQLTSQQDDLKALRDQMNEQAQAAARKDVLASWLDRFAGAAIVSAISIGVTRIMGG